MAVIRTNIYSKNLRHSMECYVILPDNVSKDKKLKTLWLYHGGSGDHTGWLYHTKIAEYVNERGFAAVLTNVHESCFVDMNSGPMYGSYVGDELPDIIWNMFPVLLSERKDNYLCGFSNGGYGALHIGLKYHEKFSAIGAFSAGDKADAVFLNDNTDKSLSRIRLFGDGDMNSTEYSVKYQARQLAQKNVERPKVYHACGSEDPWLDMNLLVKKCFEELGEKYEYTYDQIEGIGHVWPFWEEELTRYLDHLELV